MYLGLNVKIYSFSHKIENISLNLSQNSEQLQDALVTKLLGQFVILHKSPFHHRLKNLIRDRLFFFFLLQYYIL